MYSLRSSRSIQKTPSAQKAPELSRNRTITTNTKQATISFRKRRRGTGQTDSAKKQEVVGERVLEVESVEKIANSDENLVNHLSPPKRNKKNKMPQTRSSSKIGKEITATRPSRRVASKRTILANQPIIAVMRSPLRERNHVVVSKGKATSSIVSAPVNCVSSPLARKKGSCDVIEPECATPTLETPTGRQFKPTPARSVMKRLEFSELAALQQVKKSLHNSIPSSLLCRQEQLSTLTDYITAHLDGHTPGSLYISGAPGTGKTACLSHILDNAEGISPRHVVNLNCMSFKNPQLIFERIASELLEKKGLKSKGLKCVQDSLVKYITSTKEMIIIILDEIDQLDSKGQEILYTLFEWPALQKSKLLLIGIANSLDLTDRVLPRLQSHVKCQPTLVHFPPYTREQICTILNQRLGGASSIQRTENMHPAIIDPMAVQFCARKVAAVHGDLRKALDICRRAIELVETQERRDRMKSEQLSITITPNITSDTNATPARNTDTSDTANSTPAPHKPIRVTLRHIASVISEVYSSSVTSQNAQQTIPLQQKIAVCTLLCLVKGRHLKEVTLGKLHDCYVRVCRHRKLRCESEAEFMGLCSMLEARGIFKLKKAKETRLAKVVLKLEESELEHAIQDKVLISSILEHGVPAP